MQRQMVINEVPPRQRRVLVEDGPSEGVEVKDEHQAPIGRFPGLVIDARYPEGMKTEWFDPRTFVPKKQGFYELSAGGSGTVMAWYHPAEGVFYTSSGGRYDTNLEEPGFVWRGVLEVISRQRRTLLD